MGVSLKELGFILWIPPLVASVLMIFVGIHSDKLVRGGWSPVRSRIRILQWAALLAPAILLVPYVDNLVLVMALLTTAYFLAYLWLVMSNILITDLFRNSGVGLAVGVISACGTIGAAIFNAYVGATLETLGYIPVFLALACAHPIGAMILQLGYGKSLAAERADQPKPVPPSTLLTKANQP